MVLRPCSVDVVREMQGERLMFSSCFIRRMLFWNTLQRNNVSVQFSHSSSKLVKEVTQSRSSTDKRMVKNTAPRISTAISM